MATTKQQRRFNGAKNVVAAHRRNSKTATTTAPAATEQEQQEVLVNLDASPVNGASAEPAAPQAPAEAPEVAEAPEPAAVAGLTTQQELELIAQGIKTLLQIDGDIDLTPEGLMAVGLRTIRQTLVAILANEGAVEAIRAKKEELVSKAKALIAEATETAPVAAEPAPAAEPAAAPVDKAVHKLASWSTVKHAYKGVFCFTVPTTDVVSPEAIIEETGEANYVRLENGAIGYQKKLVQDSN